MARPQRFCIFCRKPGLTYEHVWPDWLKKYVPKDMTEYSSVSVTVHQTHSSAWITMFVMVAEYFDPSKVAIPQEQRGYFLENETTPQKWKIWIGYYERGNWAGHLVHFAVPISPEHDRPQIMDGDIPRPNTQTMTFTVGRLYIHVVSSVTDIFENWRLARTDLLAQIWPIQRNVIPWPLITMTDCDADQIAAAFHRMSDDAARRVDGL